jgi:hypothetical protein
MRELSSRESNSAGIGGDEMTTDQLKALKALGDAIIESVRLAGPLGAPGGHLYAALMAHGIDLDQFNQIMSGLCKAGMLQKRGECYHVLRISAGH